MGGMGGGWRGSTLLQRFTVASAGIAVALAVTLSAVTVRAIETFAVKDEAQVAAELVLRTIAPELREADFTGILPRERRAFFDGLFRAHGITDRALRVRLWGIDGRLLYTNRVEEGEVHLTGVDLSSPDGFGAFFESRRRLESDTPGVIRFFVPVQVAGDARTLGAFEIFYDLSQLHAHLRSARRTIWAVVPLGFALLYASVFVLVRRASRRLQKQQEDLIQAHIGTYEALASAIDAKDSYTGDHSTTVAALAARVGRALGLGGEAIDELRMGGRLHDLGKIGVPDAILTKPGPLDPKELAVMRRHAEGGSEILRRAPLSDRVKATVRSSHERWDGGGYPDGLAAEAIPLPARIVAVVDAYEAMTSDRPYRRALPPAEALARLRGAAGSQFDPRIVETFVGLMERGERRRPVSA